jgi:hypothetical protein
MALAAATAISFAQVSSVAAECPWPLGTWPSFVHVAKTAKTVVVGEVTESLNNNPPELAIWFRVRVDDVLRGQSDEVVSFQGLANTEEPHCTENAFLRLRIHDVIAIASEDVLPTAENGYTWDSELPRPRVAVAFVRGSPEPRWMPGMEAMTFQQVRDAVLPETDAAARSTNDATGGLSPPELALVLAGALAAALAFDRRRRITSNVA